MKKVTAAVFVMIAAALCLACGGKKPYEPKVIRVANLGVQGAWEGRIAVQDGDYAMENPTYGGNAFIGLALTLLEPWTEASAPPPLLLEALGADGTRVGGRFAAEPPEEFERFVRGGAGSTALITFKAPMAKGDKWFPSVTGFDVGSF